MEEDLVLVEVDLEEAAAEDMAPDSEMKTKKATAMDTKRKELTMAMADMEEAEDEERLEEPVAEDSEHAGEEVASEEEIIKTH